MKINLKEKTAKRLATFGIKTSTWNDVIVSLMDHADKTNFQSFGDQEDK